MHGLAQREGAIMSHTRYQKRICEDERKNLQSPLINYGDADLYICLEPAEALRRGIYASEKTVFVLNSRTIPGIMVTANLENYPSIERISKILHNYSDQIYFVDATELSLNQFNQNQQMNIIMLGFAITTGKLPFIKIKHIIDVINEWLRDPELSIKALNLGLQEGMKNTKQGK
jgi:Pyruvate/2-oxoacid:ferredoxin oxidoreductase gamma subunit